MAPSFVSPCRAVKAMRSPLGSNETDAMSQSGTTSFPLPVAALTTYSPSRSGSSAVQSSSDAGSATGGTATGGIVGSGNGGTVGATIVAGTVVGTVTVTDGSDTTGP